MKIFNTRTRSIQEFTPLKDKKVSIYVCGITPYDTTHLGHAFTYISFDALIRYLQYLQYEVIYTQNVTDINDRDTDILERARKQNISWISLADYWTKKFLQDMKTLNWRKPNNYYKASEHLPMMINLIQRLLKIECAYQKSGNVFLDITKVKEYGSLSRLTTEQMLVIAKDFEEDLANPLKRHKLDITLWRTLELHQPTHIPFFDSPFGKGRPGWHIECSAMAICSLGEQIDIHGGGEDLIFPHHESEVVQSQCATGKSPFANYWIHTAPVSYEGQKMSKSLGNLVLVSDLLKKYSSNAIRYMLLSHHYKTPWEFKDSQMNEAQKHVDIIGNILTKSKTVKNSNKEILEHFEKDLNENLSINKYLQAVWKHIKKFNSEELFTIQYTLGILGFCF